MSNRLITEDIRTNSAFPPSAAVGGVTGAIYQDMSIAQRLLAIVVTNLAAGETLTLQLFQATSAAGAGSKAITDKPAVVFTNTGALADDIIGRIECKSTDLDATNGFTFVSVTATTSVASDAAGVFVRTGILYRDGAVETHIA